MPWALALTVLKSCYFFKGNSFSLVESGLKKSWPVCVCVHAYLSNKTVHLAKSKTLPQMCIAPASLAHLAVQRGEASGEVVTRWKKRLGGIIQCSPTPISPVLTGHLVCWFNGCAR